MPLVDVYALTIVIPITGTGKLASGTDFEALLGLGTPMDKILALIQASAPIGRLGQYDGVVEISPGFEGFVPRMGSKPRHGASGKFSTVPSLSVLTFAPLDTPPPALERFLQQVIELHPWEHPIIQVEKRQVWVPS